MSKIMIERNLHMYLHTEIHILPRSQVIFCFVVAFNAFKSPDLCFVLLLPLTPPKRPESDFVLLTPSLLPRVLSHILFCFFFFIALCFVLFYFHLQCIVRVRVKNAFFLPPTPPLISICPLDERLSYYPSLTPLIFTRSERKDGIAIEELII